MSWLRLDDAILDHPKFVRLDARAFRLWVAVLGYSSRHRTGGAVSNEIVKLLARRIGCPLRLGILLETPPAGYEHGLWERRGDGIQVHDFDAYQPSAETRADLSSKRAEAGRESGRARREKRRTNAERSQDDRRTVAERSQDDRETVAAQSTDEDKPSETFKSDEQPSLLCSNPVPTRPDPSRKTEREAAPFPVVKALQTSQEAVPAASGAELATSGSARAVGPSPRCSALAAVEQRAGEENDLTAGAVEADEPVALTSPPEWAVEIAGGIQMTRGETFDVTEQWQLFGVKKPHATKREWQAWCLYATGHAKKERQREKDRRPGRPGPAVMAPPPVFDASADAAEETRRRTSVPAADAIAGVLGVLDVVRTVSAADRPSPRTGTDP